MPRAAAPDRIRRIELIAAQLKGSGSATVADLAETHGVSRRTIARDLNVMRDQGMPIDTDRGRGGSVRLDRNWGVGRLNLSYAEAVDLLISLAVAEQMNSPIFLSQLAVVRRQLVASFSADKRFQVDQIKARILIGRSASTAVQQTVVEGHPRVMRDVHQAFLARRLLEIEYRAESGEQTKRRIEPQYLLLNYPVWYVLAWDHLRDAPRTFRYDRIAATDPLPKTFRLLPKSAFQSALEQDVLI